MTKNPREILPVSTPVEIPFPGGVDPGGASHYLAQVLAVQGPETGVGDSQEVVALLDRTYETRDLVVANLAAFFTGEPSRQTSSELIEAVFQVCYSLNDAKDLVRKAQRMATCTVSDELNSGSIMFWVSFSALATSGYAQFQGQPLER
jgi:hypothetical protein